MSLKVAVQISVSTMDGTEIVGGLRSDTVVNVNPGDPTAEPLLAAQTLERLTNETLSIAQERLGDYAQMVGRMMA